MIFTEDILVKANVRIVARERGKIKEIQEGHNIFTTIGREYVINLMRGDSSETVHYLGVGIGGNRQTLDIASLYPGLASSYPGGNTFSDDDPSITTLERPVQVTPGVWLGVGVIAAPSTPNTILRITREFTEDEINLTGTYPVVPISEAGLYISSENPAEDPYTGVRQTVIAYKGGAPISKTPGISIDIRWEVRL